MRASRTAKPDRATWTILIKGAQSRAEAEGYWSEVVGGGQLDVVALNAYLESLVRLRAVASAVSVLRSPPSPSLRPDVISYSTVVVGLLRAAPRSPRAAPAARRLYGACRARGVEPDALFARLAVDACLSSAAEVGGREDWRDLVALAMRALGDCRPRLVREEGVESWARRRRLVLAAARRAGEKERSGEWEDAFLESRGWNAIDSSFSWGGKARGGGAKKEWEKEKEKDRMKRKDWDSFNSGFRLF
jgi:hypothetical protein